MREKFVVLHIYDNFTPNHGYIENNLPRFEMKYVDEVHVIANKHYIINNNIFKFSNYTFSIINYIKYIWKVKPNIISLPYCRLKSLIIIIFGKIIGSKLVATIGMDPIIEKDGFHNWLNNQLFIIISRMFLDNFIDVFIEATPQNITRDLQLFKIEDNKLFFHTLGADISYFYPDELLRNKYRIKYGIEENEVVIVYAGKLEEVKKIHDLIDVFNKLSCNEHLVKLFIFGNGEREYSNYLKKQMGERTYLYDFAKRDELINIFRMSDIGVWPGGPTITIQEAISSGLPVIIKDSDHTKHLINGNGFSFNNNQQLLDQISLLITDNNLREDMANNSRLFAMNELDWDVIAKQRYELYKTLK